MKTEHLSDEQFSDLLAGETAQGAAAAHLDICPACDRELAALRSAVSDLRGFSQRWAEERASRIGSPSNWAFAWHRMPAWGLATSLLVCGMAVGTHLRGVAPSPSAEISQAHSIASAPSDDELAEDNQLLRSIDQEINRQVRPQVSASELTVSSKSLSQPVLREVSN